MITSHTNQYAARHNGTPDQSSSVQSPNNRSDDIQKILHAMTKAEAMTMPAEAVQHPPVDSTPPKSSNKNKKWRKKTDDKRSSAADDTESFDGVAATVDESPLPFEKSNGERRQGPQVSVNACWENFKTKPITDLNLSELTFQQYDDPFSSPHQSYEFSISASSTGNGNASKAHGKNNKKKDRSSPKYEDEGPNRFHDAHPSNTAPISDNDHSSKLAPSTKKNNATLPTPIFTIQTTAAGNPSSIEFKKTSPRKSKKKSGRRSNNNNNKNGKNNNNNINNEDDELWKMADPYVIDYSTNAQGAAILASLGQYERNYGYYMPYHHHSMAPDHDSYSRADSPIEPHYETTTIAPPNLYYTQGSAAAAAASTYAMYYPPALEAYYGMIPYPTYEEMYPSYYVPMPPDEMYYCPPHYEGRDEEGMVPSAGVERIKLNVDAPSFVPKTIIQ